MPSTKRLRAPLVLLFGMMTLTTMALAGPASAADPVYPPVPPRVLGTSASNAPTQVAGESAVASAGAGAGASELAFTGANAVGVGALGGLLLVGGAVMVSTSRRRKVNA